MFHPCMVWLIMKQILATCPAGTKARPKSSHCPFLQNRLILSLLSSSWQHARKVKHWYCVQIIFESFLIFFFSPTISISPVPFTHSSVASNLASLFFVFIYRRTSYVHSFHADGPRQMEGENWEGLKKRGKMQRWGRIEFMRHKLRDGR